MLPEKSLENQLRLHEIIYDLAKSIKGNTELRGIAVSLCEIYSEDFRHNYSALFPIVLEVIEKDEYYVDYLSENISELRKMVEEDHLSEVSVFNGLYKPLSKLSDHINLEIGHYNYYWHDNIIEVRNTKADNDKLREELVTVRDELNTAKNELNEAKVKLTSTQADIVAILGVFASIVFAFTGGITVLGEALKGMLHAPFFKSTYFILLCCLVIFNIIYIVLHFAGKIVGVDINKKTMSNTSSMGKMSKWLYEHTIFFQKRSYLFWFNIIMIFLIAAVLVAWNIDDQCYTLVFFD